MKNFHAYLASALLAVVAGPTTIAQASQDAPKPAQSPADLGGFHDFDFLVGEWRVHHRRLRERLAGSHDWVEFEGTCGNRPLMAGWGNVDENTIDLPGDAYRGVGLRSYDPKTGLWTIWWLDGRNPSADLDPPVKGRFEHGVGTFYSDDTFNGKPVRVRYQWSAITPVSARWEQAYSSDAGKTWETNWVMNFQRGS
ncbi:MAG: hypothetical protein ABI843_03780 [Dokdonella sp.]